MGILYGTAWEIEEDQIVRNMNVAGCTAAQIADKLPIRTRNAVLGYMHRNNIKSGNAQKGADRNNAGAKASVAVRNARARAKHRNTKSKQELRLEDEPQIDRASLNHEEFSRTEGLPLSVLGNGQCVWPVTKDKPFLFCGILAADGSPYCTKHHLIAHKRPSSD